MKKSFLFFLFFAFPIFAVEPEASLLIQSASCHVKDTVYALTGQAIQRRTDAVVSGFEPIPITRMYASENQAALNWEGGWAIFPHTQFVLYLTEKGFLTTVQEADGSVGRYCSVNKYPLRLAPDLENSYPSPFHREISARTDIRNHHLLLLPAKEQGFEGAIFYAGNGSVRKYTCARVEHHPLRWTFLLKEERKANGNLVLYSYDGSGRLLEIVTTNPSRTRQYSKLTFQYRGKKEKDRDCTLVGSDGTVLNYRFWRPQDEHIHDYFYFEEVSGNGVIPEKVLYDVGYKKDPKRSAFNKTRGPFVKNVSLGNQNALQLSYYYPGNNKPALWDFFYLKNARDHICDKVRDLQEPVGENGEYITTHSFLYEHCTEKGPGVTKVKDILGNETHFHFDVHFKPSRIDFYTPQGLVRSEIFRWEGRDLVWHILKDPTDENTRAYRYEYDPKGNVIKHILFGNLTGTCNVPFDIDHLENGIESYQTLYTYSTDGFHLPLEKVEENGLRTLYSYIPKTDRLKSKIICNQDHVLTRHFYFYDEDYFLTEERVDDGETLRAEDSPRTERKIIRYTPNARNFPATIEEYGWDRATGEEVLLQKKVLIYNERDQVEKEEFYDADQNFLYATTTQYDQSLITQQTDPLGQKTVYKYDARQQLVRKEKEGSAIENFTYTPTGQLSEKKMIGEETQTTRYEYDLLGHKKREIDPYGAVTEFVCDRFAQVVQMKDPSLEVSRFQYDFLGQIRCQQEPNQDQTLIWRNAYGNPIQVMHADGSYENYQYDKKGNVKKAIDPMGTTTCFNYDCLGRLLDKEILCSTGKRLSLESYTYDALHLRAMTDPLGWTTTYTYDLHGRKQAEEKEGIKTTYDYDALGRVWAIIQGDLKAVTERDPLERILEERKESLQGYVLFKKRTIYSDWGRTVQEITYPQNQEAIIKTQLDSFGRTLCVTDPYGQQTSYQYLLSPHAKITTDAAGRRTIETYNNCKKIAQLQKLDEEGKEVCLETYQYDSNGNLSEQISQVYRGSTLSRLVKTQWIYGPCNRLSQWIEAAETLQARTTSYTYTPSGLLFQTIKPSGIVLQNTYDGLGHLVALKSSDGSIDLAFTPNALGQVLFAEDLKAGSQITRVYDPAGNLLKEQQSQGFILEKTYDSLGRALTLRFPDASLVTKTYDPLFLREVQYAGETHRYTAYDLAGNLLQEELPFQAGYVDYTVDLLSRTQSLYSPYHRQRIGSFDPIGKVESLETNLLHCSHSSIFAYDALGQLIEDGLHHYLYDSHGNRVEQDGTLLEVDALNQSLTVQWDLDGNPIYKEGMHLSYDALDRLIAIDFPDQTRVEYTYDPFHRRISKTLPTQTIHYLYDGNLEIGSIDSQGTTLRILGNTEHAEIGSAVLIQQKGELYLPLYDLQGSTSLLLSSSLTLSEECFFTPFGVCHTPFGKNPWRYLSKHTDPETGFVFFGRRYYDPSKGRFLTRDPQGYTDSLNLYTYALNDPFTHFDPFGLENEPTDLTAITTGGIQGTVEGAWQGFMHPVDSLHHMASDITAFSSSILTGNFSTLLATWKSMDPEEKAHFCMTRVAQVGGIGASVYFLGGPILNGVKMGLSLGMTAFNSLSKNLGIEFTQISISKNPVAYDLLQSGASNLNRKILKDYLSETRSLDKNQIVKDLESIGFKIKGASPDGRFIEFKDKFGNLRVKIHPSDKITKYDHMHVYNKKGDPLNINLKRVDKTSIEAHIPYGGN